MSIGIVCQFSTDPPAQLPGARNWVDISNRVLSYDIQRGKTRILDRFESGTMDLNLKNTDRFLDPENAQSPYYGSMLPMRPIRFGFVVGGVTYWQYFGFIERWPQIWNGPSWAEVDMTCVDGFELLSNHYLASNYAILQETSGANLITYSSVQIGYVGNSTTVTHVNTGTLGVSVVGYVITVDINAGVTTNAQIAAAVAAYAPAAAIVNVVAAVGNSFAFAATALSGGTFVQEFSGARIQDVLNFTQWPFGPTLANSYASAPIGIVTSGRAYTTVYATAVAVGSVGNAITITWAGGSGPFSITVVGNAITFTGFIVGASALASAVAAYAPAAALITISFASDGAFISNANAQLAGGNGATGTALSPGTIQVQAQAIPADESTTALDHAQAVELTEDGALYIAKDGTVAYLDQNALATGQYVTPQAKFVDATADPDGVTSFGYQTLQGDFDKDLIFNNIQSTRLNGLLQIASDPTSDTDYFTRTLQIQPLSVDDNSSLALAEIYLAKFRQPYFRFEPMQLFPGENENFWKALCQLELMYAVSISRHPPGAGQPYTLSGQIINIQIQGKPPVQQTVWSLQVDPNESGLVLILSDPTYGLLDTYVLGF